MNTNCDQTWDIIGRAWRLEHCAKM